MSLIFSEYASSMNLYGDQVADVTGISGMLFEVKGTTELYLGLSQTIPSYLITELYEIAFDYKYDILQLRHGEGGNLLDEYSGTVNSSGQYRRYWTTWGNGHIQVGQGFTFGQNILVSTVDNTYYDVNFIAVASGFHETSHWLFYLNGNNPIGKF